MGGWEELTEFLRATDGAAVTLSFEQIEKVMGMGLPASARDHRPFWSNSKQNPYSRHWVIPGFKTTTRGVTTGFMRFERVRTSTVIRTGERIRAVTPAPPVDPRNRKQPHVPKELVGGEVLMPDLILLGCVKKKRSIAQRAKDLYCSPLWAKRRAYAEASGQRWLILSAQHGLVDPDDVLEPYDLSLTMMGRDEQHRWAAGVDAELAVALSSADSPVAEFHAGMDYQRFLRPLLEARGITVRYPLEGLTQGAQLAWYNSEIGVPQRRQETSGGTDRNGWLLGLGSQSVTKGQVRAIADRLLDPAFRVEAKDFGPFEWRLNKPGIYSWWADDLARDMLGQVLQADIPELIYVGQAGATMWPSGKTSDSTLIKRITNQHLKGASKSTLRTSLAAILHGPLDLNFGAGKLDLVSRERLSAFVRNRLSVTPVSFNDADSLGALEKAIVSLLDPPFNLVHVDKQVPPRPRLTELRRGVRQQNNA